MRPRERPMGVNGQLGTDIQRFVRTINSSVLNYQRRHRATRGGRDRAELCDKRADVLPRPGKSRGAYLKGCDSVPTRYTSFRTFSLSLAFVSLLPWEKTSRLWSFARLHYTRAHLGFLRSELSPALTGEYVAATEKSFPGKLETLRVEDMVTLKMTRKLSRLDRGKKYFALSLARVWVRLCEICAPGSLREFFIHWVRCLGQRCHLEYKTLLAFGVNWYIKINLIRALRRSSFLQEEFTFPSFFPEVYYIDLNFLLQWQFTIRCLFWDSITKS